jgi:hypothetical protein
MAAASRRPFSASSLKISFFRSMLCFPSDFANTKNYFEESFATPTSSHNIAPDIVLCNAIQKFRFIKGPIKLAPNTKNISSYICLPERVYHQKSLDRRNLAAFLRFKGRVVAVTAGCG